MTATLTLEDFALAGAAAGAPEVPAPPLTEADRVAAYEDGYRAGWEDAGKAQREDQARIGAEFARNLQEISFTFHEARAHIIEAMGPLLDELLETLLPELMQEEFPQTVKEVLAPLIAEAADAPVDIVVGPGGAEQLQATVAECSGGAVRIREEPSLAQGQAYLRVGKTERRIDLTGALTRIREAADALRQLNRRTLQHA